MKIVSLKAVFTTLCMGIAFIGAAQKATYNDTLMLSLDKCITIALSDNPSIKVADMEIERMDYYNKEVLGQLLPSISFNAQYSRTLAKQVMYLNMGALGGGASSGTTEEGSESEGVEETPTTSAASKSSGGGGIKMGLDNSYTMGFSASMPLVAPQLWKTLKLSDTQILQSMEAARKSRLDMVNQVKTAYYSLLLAEDSYKVILESYENAKETHDIYTKKHKLGAASEYDVLRTSVAVKNIEPQLMQGEITIKQARLQLCLLMNMDVNVPFKPTTTLSDYEKTMYENTLAIDKSIDQNSDLKMLDIQTQLLNDALDIQRMSWYPTLALTANYNWTSMSDGNPLKNFRWSPYSTVGLSLSFPLFQGGQRYNKIKQARIQVEEMSFQRENLEQAINMQVELAVDNIHVNVKQIAACAENVKQAERAHEIMDKSFKIGAATYLDFRDAQLALTNTRLTYLQAIYNYLIATNNLELLLGNTDIEKYNISE
ncbi:MAG: TolC family protein [Muribaculaceae bacterium]|nr:TolC family protein [Muribaculaceae bacterium]